jgi:GR25 family glycosyltransferase involved in LPS biosynthesis
MIPKFVITLERSNNIDNFKNIYDKNNINYQLFYAVDARQNQHLKYRNIIHPISLLLTPKKILGCALSHILLAKIIVKNNIEYSLILEDDTYPYDYVNLDNNIEKIITNFNKINKKWDIINLHTDGILQNNNNYVNLFSGSSAAYILSISGAKKLANSYAIHNIDVYSSVNNKFLKYKSSKNLFWTDENNSVIRNNYENIIKSFYIYILSILLKFRGEKNWSHLLSYDIICLPIINYNIDAFTIMLISNIYFLYIFYKYNIKNNSLIINQ